ncbi:hypothetical protein [Streptomyces anulatus]|uniref:hypothetical protein n=1 Tax=Streptomyces anulatus TaxID=1892 RepID=UPI001C27E863|nr:hypothetical protein [Streptomyces anulatus]
MAKTDRNAVMRSSITGENYKQALHWLREHGLTDGAVPDADNPQQQLLEAALAYALARTPLGPLPQTLFGITKASPSPASLTVWPAPGAEADVLARLLPSRSPGGTLDGVPGLRWSPAGRYLALTLPGLSARVLLAASARDAKQLPDSAGLHVLTSQPPAGDEVAAWREMAAVLHDEAASWSRALRRPLLAAVHREGMPRHAPDWQALAGDEETLRPRPLSPAAFRRARVVHVRAVRSGAGASTVSAQLAYGLARAGWNVALVTDEWLLHEETRRAPAGEVWHTVDVPSGGGRLQAASAGQFGMDFETRAVEASQHGQLVILDIGSARTDALPDADLSIVVGRYAGQDWTRTEIIDRRPRPVRVYDQLDQLFGRHRRREDDPLRDLLSALDSEFVAYTAARLDDGGEEHTEPYDRQDAEDVAEWWQLFRSAPLHPQDVLPAEDCVPLDRWRQDLLDFIDDEAGRRYPDVWERARAVWPKHSQNRNLQRLGTEGETAAELADRLSTFLVSQAAEGSGTEPVSAAERRTWSEGRLARWLDERFTTHLGHDAVLLAPSPLDRLLGLLDARFTPRIPDDTLKAESSQDRWWDALAAARSLDEFDADLDGTADSGENLNRERTRFLDLVGAEGLRRYTALWTRASELWAAHHAELTAARRRPFQPAPHLVPGLRQAFVEHLRRTDVTDVTGWESMVGRWVAGERTDAERLPEFADLVDRRYHPADADVVAEALVQHMLTARLLRNHVPTAVVVTFHRDWHTTTAVDEVGDALARRGVAGLRRVPQLRRLERPPFDPGSWNDRQVRAVQEDLAALVTTALDPTKTSRRRR